MSQQPPCTIDYQVLNGVSRTLSVSKFLSPEAPHPVALEVMAEEEVTTLLMSLSPTLGPQTELGPWDGTVPEGQRHLFQEIQMSSDSM